MVKNISKGEWCKKICFLKAGVKMNRVFMVGKKQAWNLSKG